MGAAFYGRRYRISESIRGILRMVGKIGRQLK
jgi:hypothetical protein